MDAWRFDDSYIERRPLANGRTLVLRLVRPSDASLLLRAFERLSPQSRYRRFFAYKKHLSPDEVRYFTDVDGINHFAIAALIERAGRGEEGVGVARFVRLAVDPLAAEAALTIIDDCQHHGIGRALLDRLRAAAAERGVRELRFSVLATNAPMLQLIRKLEGPTGRFQARVGSGVIELIMPLPRAEKPAEGCVEASVG